MRFGRTVFNSGVVHTVHCKTRNLMLRRRFAFLFCILLLAIPSDAAKRAFTIEDLYHIRGVDELHISSDGKTVHIAQGGSNHIQSKGLSQRIT